MNKKIILFILTIFLLLISLKYLVWGRFSTMHQDSLTYELVIQNHHFYPNRIEAPAGRKIILLVKNLDSTVEEFESYDLKREKIVPAGKIIKIVLAPLQAGEYKFFGEFHEETAQGVLVIKNYNDNTDN